MEESNILLIGLLEYIEQVEKLKRKPSYVVPSDIFAAYQAEMKGLPGVEFNLQAEGDDIWLRIPRIKEIPAPDPDENLTPWVSISKSPDKNPQLKSEIILLDGKKEIGRENLEEHPEIQRLFDWYVKELWEPWSSSEKPRRRTISFYNKLFAVQQAISTDGSETPIELAWGIGCASWKRAGSTTAVRYPLITQTCEIYLNPKSFDLEIRPRDVDARIELDCYADQEIQGVRPLEDFWKSTIASAADRVNPFEASTYEGVLKSAVLHLDSNGEYLNNQIAPVLPAPSEKLCVTDTWVLFGRKRSEHIFLQDIERLKGKLASTKSIPSVIEGFVQHGDTAVKVRESVHFRGLSSSASGDGIRELYFPMPYNEEQVSIVEKLETNDGVVVQGPPGTGKTHTIANVICHFLAQGKRVLVTAKGESPLAVLQEKLPEQIRPLSVSLLTDERDGMKQFEHSIQTIASSINALNPTQAEKLIHSLDERLSALHAKISYVDQSVKVYADKHMKHYQFQGREISPEDLAKFVMGNAGSYSWLEDEINSKNGGPKFGDGDIRSLRQARISVSNDLSYLEFSIPAPDSFPAWPIILALHKDLVRSKDIENSVTQGDIIGLSDSTQGTFEEAKKFTEFLANRASLIDEIDKSPFEWSDHIKARLLDVGEDDAAMQLLWSLLRDIGMLESRRKEILSNASTVPHDAELNEDFIAALERLMAGKGAFVLPFGKQEARSLLVEVTVKGLRPANPDEWKLVSNQIEYLLNARRLVARWNAIANEFGFPATQSDVEASFKTLINYQGHIDDIRRLIAEFDSKLIEKIKRVFGTEVSSSLAGEGERLVTAIRTSLTQHVDKGRLLYAMHQVSDLIVKLDGRSGPVVSELRQFLNAQLGNKDILESSLQEQWHALMGELKRLNGIQPAFREIDRVSTLIQESGATKWALAIKTIPAEKEGDVQTPTDWLEAWNWRAAKTFIEQIDGHKKLKGLFDERRTLEGDMAKSYQELIAQKTWLGVFNNSPEDIRQALQAYLNAIQAMGAGTGIRAVRFRKNAREAMLRAYKAVPCWILPQWRVSEALPPEIGLFDLVIIDEASQSDIWALPALLRGKKLLVVGDHKQVSPSAVGMKEVKIQELVDRFLKDQPHGSEMTPDKSIYDLARVVFAGNSVMLKEHFRCVPAIIEFSNREFYKGDIKPLRLPRASERLDPPLIDVFVKGGYRKGDINQPEAKAIVDEIKSILASPEMSGRTIGVVTLMGMEQAAYITKLVNQEISPTDIVERMISVGAPPVFQGRERDIMLISNVLEKGNNSAANKLEIEQRINVALSRARDRMYLFRSVDEKDFNPGSLTAKLIRHFRHPFTQDAKRVATLKELCESDFEREMFDLLTKRNFRVQPQVKCGGYRIDFVVEGSEGRRLAVECDGDKFHGPGQWMDDMTRQRVLERAGWTFWRCFASSFVMRRQEVVADLLATLEKMGIEPLGAESVDNTQWVAFKEVDPYEIDLTEEESEDVAME